jgi:hypothetical protein
MLECRKSCRPRAPRHPTENWALTPPRWCKGSRASGAAGTYCHCCCMLTSGAASVYFAPVPSHAILCLALAHQPCLQARLEIGNILSSRPVHKVISLFRFRFQRFSWLLHCILIKRKGRVTTNLGYSSDNRSTRHKPICPTETCTTTIAAMLHLREVSYGFALTESRGRKLLGLDS